MSGVCCLRSRPRRRRPATRARSTAFQPAAAPRSAHTATWRARVDAPGRRRGPRDGWFPRRPLPPRRNACACACVDRVPSPRARAARLLPRTMLREPEMVARHGDHPVRTTDAGGGPRELTLRRASSRSSSRLVSDVHLPRLRHIALAGPRMKGRMHHAMKARLPRCSSSDAPRRRAPWLVVALPVHPRRRSNSADSRRSGLLPAARRADRALPARTSQNAAWVDHTAVTRNGLA